MSTDEYFEANRRNWDERVPIHEASAFYDMASFRAGRNSLWPVEIAEVGDVGGKTLLHLQCHFGQDTLSWARLGAHVTGLDFSGPAIETARRIAGELGIEAQFVEANLYDAVDALAGRQFDIVYTGRGALVWLPDLTAWAEIVAALLAPGGVFYVHESHPFSHTFDDEASDGLRIRYPYFHSPEPDRWDEPGTYADLTADTKENASYEWSHTLGEIVTALGQAGLVIEFLHEVDHQAWKQLPFMVPGEEPATWVLPEHRASVPLGFSIRAQKPSTSEEAAEKRRPHSEGATLPVVGERRAPLPNHPSAYTAERHGTRFPLRPLAAAAASLRRLGRAGAATACPPPRWPRPRPLVGSHGCGVG